VPGQYTFGDDDLAAQRLALVAATFEIPSRRLLRAAIPAGAELVLDLGCGPGHSTRLIADVCSPRRVVGLEVSPRFVDLARSSTPAGAVAIEYDVTDVTAVPLPHAPADAVYVRLLLAHLPGAVHLVSQWRSQLRPGGVLVIDEIEDIEAPDGALRDYERLVVARVAREGGDMYAGRVLAPLGGELVEVMVDTAHAARMFRMNLTSWGPDAICVGLTDEVEVGELDRALADLEVRPRPPAVRWVLRQLVLGS
jgi:SAM-dependent methyltransferase